MRKYFDKLYKGSKEDFIKLMINNLKTNKKMFIVTSNPETFMIGTKNKDINDLLLDEDTTLVPDGISIVKACKILKYDIKERITGIDLSTELLKICDDNKYNIALLGASEEVINTLVNNIKKDYPNINIVDYENGYTEDKDSFFNKISKYNVDVCLVALGVPKQEELIYKHLNKFNKGIFIGVGGSFDVLSGLKKRAPKIFIKLNLEWLYRIVSEPKRLKRFYNSNVKFIFKVKDMQRLSKL